MGLTINTHLSMYKATDIAHVFVQKSLEEKIPVTQMQLQKMVYFAHGLYLAYTGGQKLVEDTFEAWKFGPVVPGIYEQYRLFGSSPITESLLESTHPVHIDLNSEAQQVIDETWNALKNISGIQLSRWTHETGSAWHAYYRPNTNGVVEAGIQIPDNRIIEDFKQFLTEEA